MAGEASVGIRFQTVGIDETLIQIGRVQEALGQMGVIPANPYNPALFRATPERGAGGVEPHGAYNGAAGGGPLYPTPSQTPAMGGAGNQIQISQAQIMIQTAQIIVQNAQMGFGAGMQALPGGGGFGGGTGPGTAQPFNPDARVPPGQWPVSDQTQMYTPAQLAQAQKNPFANDMSQGPAQQQNTELQSLMNQMKNAFSGYQLASFVTHTIGSAMSYQLSGGDMTQGKAFGNFMTGLPIVGPLLAPIIGPQLSYDQAIQGADYTGQAVGLPVGDLSQPDTLGIGAANARSYIQGLSPSYLDARRRMNLQGIQMPKVVRDRFAIAENQPGYMHPSIRADFLNSYSQERTSPEAMGVMGYRDPGGDMDLNMYDLALARGDWTAAFQLGNAGWGVSGQGDHTRRIAGQVMRSQFRQRSAASGSRLFGAQARLGRARGDIDASAGMISGADQLGVEAGEFDTEADISEGLEQKFRGQNGSEAAAEAARLRKQELRAQAAEARATQFSMRREAVDLQRDSLSSAGGAIRGGQYSTQAQRTYLEGGALEDRMRATHGAEQAAQEQVAIERRALGQLAMMGAGPLVMQEQERRIESTRLAATEAQITRAQNPVDIQLDRALSRTQFEVNVLQNIPGAYGNIRGALAQQMTTLEASGSQIVQMRDRQRQENGGKLSEAAEFEYQRRLQDVALQQASAAQQLSYGWENRLISSVVGTPGTFGLDGAGFSQRDAVLRGVMNPHMGANQGQLPFFLRQATLDSLPETGIPGMRGFTGGELGDGFGVLGRGGSLFGGTGGGAVGGPTGGGGAVGGGSPMITMPGARRGGAGGAGGPGVPVHMLSPQHAQDEVDYFIDRPGRRGQNGFGGGGNHQVIEIILRLPDGTRIGGGTVNGNAGQVTSGLAQGGADDLLQIMGMRVANQN